MNFSVVPIYFKKYFTFSNSISSLVIYTIHLKIGSVCTRSNKEGFISWLLQFNYESPGEKGVGSQELNIVDLFELFSLSFCLKFLFNQTLAKYIKSRYKLRILEFWWKILYSLTSHK